MVSIKYLDLDKEFKRKLSGSISLQLKYSVNFNNYKSITADEIFNNWIEISTTELYGDRYYINKGHVIKSFALDDELLQDLREEVIKRLEKMVDKYNKKLTTEKATEKQIKYANKLYEKIHGQEGTYKAEEYTKEEIGIIINKLLEEVKEKAKEIDSGKVIKLFE